MIDAVDMEKYDILAEAVKLAIAPIFLLTAIAGLLGTLTQRLARVVDRSRELNNYLRSGSHNEERRFYRSELSALRRRGIFINSSAAFLVLSGIFVGVTVLALFFSHKILWGTMVYHYSYITFSVSIFCFIIALILFLSEIILASYSIRWNR